MRVWVRSEVLLRTRRGSDKDFLAPHSVGRDSRESFLIRKRGQDTILKVYESAIGLEIQCKIRI